MKRPTSIQIMGEWIKVRYLDEIPGDEYIHGDYNNDKNLIRIRIQDGPTMAKTLLHEICHCIFKKSGWSEELGDRTEEALCQLLESVSLIYSLKQGKGNIRWRRD